jgi:peptidoglycan/LPS O-acetylase OafA/YrhL
MMPPRMKAASIAEGQTYRPFIDGLRGIAILMVVAVHTSQWCGNSGPETAHVPGMKNLIDSGARGVQLFFLLSAFTLFASSKNRFQVDHFPRLAFYVRRAFRILPFWWLITAVYVVVRHQSWLDNAPNFLMYFGFLRYREGLEAFPLGWSIFVEETFYLILPIVFTKIDSLGRGLWLLVVTLQLSFAWSYFADNYGVPRSNAFIFFFPLNQWFCFALGILIYHLSTATDLFRNLVLDRRMFLLLDTAVVFSVWHWLRSDFRSACIPLFLLVLASIPAGTVCGRITRNPLLIRFGTYCYSIYLCHDGLLKVMNPIRVKLMSKLHMGDAWWELQFFLWFPAVCAVCLAVGYSCFSIIERPCVTLGKQIVARLSTALERRAVPSVNV